jgi:hypothetical protein
MLTEILIKPFIEDLKHAGIEDTTPYEQGFMAGMAALSDILSENMDNQPHLFAYLGMAISEGMQWVESQVNESPEKAPQVKFEAPVFPGTKEFIPQLDDPRWIEPNDSYLGYNCYAVEVTGGVCKGVLNCNQEQFYYYVRTNGGFQFGVTKIIPLDPAAKCEGWLDLIDKLVQEEENPRERKPTLSSDEEEEHKDLDDLQNAHYDYIR